MTSIHRWLGLSILVAAFATNAEAASVTRGPYLQSGTDTSLVVRWRTDVATDSRVRYGDAPGNLTSLVDLPAVSREHEITLENLSPDTVYYYAVGTTAGILAGGDASYFFFTPPMAGVPKPTRIWVLGDSGTADANAAAVRDAYYAFTGDRHTDLWLMLGDNAYDDGTDSDYQRAVFDMYPTMLRKSVLWPTLGNHDGHTADSGTQSGPYYDIFTLPRNGEAGGIASGTEAYYSFDYGNIHFIVLDSFDSDRSPFGAMLTWLQADLATTTQDWVIAYWHHPPYSKGSHDSDSDGGLVDMRENALPVLEAGGVDLVLSGHSHSYERSFLIDGHYGSSGTLVPSMVVDGGDGRETGDGAYQKPGPVAHEGAVYTVAGSSGKTSGGSLNHPAMFISLNVLGSVVLNVDGNRLDTTFLESTGAVRDTFTMLKSPAGVPAGVIEVRVSARSDDAEESSSGSVKLGSSDLQLVRESSDQTVGMRFRGLAIPQGSVITKAFVQFQVDEKKNKSGLLAIQAEAIDDAPTFRSARKNISTRARTAASVAWSPPRWMKVRAAGADQRTPDIAAVIQEVVDRPGWAGGNSVVIVITGTGKRVAESFNGAPAAAPLLHVEYAP